MSGKEERRLLEDNRIIELYFERSGAALTETSAKYGGYCKTIAYNILQNAEDTEECLNDTLQKLWELIPPLRPDSFKTFAGRIIRNIALNRRKRETAARRGGGRACEALDELEECLAAKDTVEGEVDRNLLREAIDRFLYGLPREKRMVFVRRYWYMSGVREISEDYGIGAGKVKSMLFRMRAELRKYLEKEGIEI